MSANNSSATIGEQTGPDLDLVEALVNPRASDALLGEFIAQIVLGLLVSLTGCFIILLKFIKALRSHRAGLPRPYADLWLVRRLHKPKGTYIVTNSILIWTITETIVSALMATAVILTAKTYSGAQNFDHLTLWTSAPLQGLGPAAWQVMTGTLITFLETRPSLSLPSPWIFHIFAHAVPISLFVTGMTLDVLVDAKFVQLRDLAKQAFQGDPEMILLNLQKSFGQAAGALHKQMQLSIGLNVVSFVWLGLLTLFSILPGLAVIQALRNTIRATNTSAGPQSKQPFSLNQAPNTRMSLDSDAERRKTTLKRKNQFMLAFFVFSLCWIIAFTVIITVHFATLTDSSDLQFMSLSTDQILRMQFVDVYYVALAGMLVLGIALFGRELYSFSETSHAQSMLARMDTMASSQSDASVSEQVTLPKNDNSDNIDIVRSRSAVFKLSPGPDRVIALRSPHLTRSYSEESR